MWLPTRFRSRRGISPRLARRDKAPTIRLNLEPLEDRLVLSTIAGTLLNTGTNTPLAGWTVWLDVNNNQQLDSTDVVTTTDANGQYAFDTTNVPPGITGSNGIQGDVVRLDLQTGTGGRWVNTTSADAIINRTTTPNATADFGVTFQSDTGVAPVGSESPVNVTPTAAPQNTSLSGTDVSVSADTQGDYVVAWENYTSGEVYARVFNADGSARTGDIAVGAGKPSTNNYYYPMPQVAMAGNGEFMVAWNGPDGIHAQAYSADGTPVGSTDTVLRFNTKTSGGVSGVAADSTGDFVVVYNAESISKFGSSAATVYAQRFASSGAANGSAIKVATQQLVNGNQSVAMDGAGNFVVAWDDDVTSRTGTSATHVYAQQYTASGSKSGSQITVASGTTTANGMTLYPAVAMNASGQFVVTYEFTGSPDQGRAQVYNANGTPAGALVTFAAGGETDASPAAVAMDSAGNILFSWTPPSNSNSIRNEVRMEWLAAGSSTPVPETIVNTTTQGSHQLPGVAATGNDSFVVVWQGYGASDPAGIYSQRFGPVSSTATISTLSQDQSTQSQEQIDQVFADLAADPSSIHA